jgi:hypothetical protein
VSRTGVSSAALAAVVVLAAGCGSAKKASNPVPCLTKKGAIARPYGAKQFQSAPKEFGLSKATAVNLADGATATVMFARTTKGASGLEGYTRDLIAETGQGGADTSTLVSRRDRIVVWWRSPPTDADLKLVADCLNG